MPILLDKTTDASNPTTYTLGYSNLYFMGQSVTGLSGTVDGIVFRIGNTHVPTSGHLEAVIFSNVTGTFGSNMVPVGDNPAAVSEPITLPNSTGSGVQSIFFSFTGANKLVFDPGSNYIIGLRYTHADYSQYMSVQVHGGTTASPGNYTARQVGGSYTAIGSVDLYYEVYAEGAGVLLIDTDTAQSASATITVPTPSNVENDVMVALLSSESGTPEYVAPTGWTEIPLGYTGSYAHSGLSAFYKISDGNEAATLSFTQSISKKQVAVVSSFRGVDTTDPIGASLYTKSGATAVTSYDAPSVTTTVDQAYLLRVWTAMTGLSGFTAPPGTNLIAERSYNAAVGAVSETQATAGDTGTKNATWTSTTKAGAATIALNPFVGEQVSPGYTLTIDSAKIASNLTDFPVYVNLNDVKPGITLAEAQGVRVYKADGTTELPREIVSKDEMHFKADSISSTVDTVFVIDINEARADYATNSTYGAENVWTNGYVAVWHLDGLINSVNSTADLTENGTVPARVGKLGVARGSYSSSNYLDNATVTLGASPDELSVQAWVHPTNLEGGSGVFTSEYTGSRFIMNITGSPDYSVSTGIDTRYTAGASNNTVAVNNQWYKIDYNASETEGRIQNHVDGQPDSIRDYSPGFSFALDAFTGFRIGNRSDYQLSPAAGYVDEVRIGNVVRSSDWIAAEYANQSNPSAFYAIAPEEGGDETGPLPVTSGLHRRYDASQLTLSDGADVTVWPDSSGNGGDLVTTGGTPPTYQSGAAPLDKPAVVFSGANSSLDNLYDTIIYQPFSIFFVMAHTTSSGVAMDHPSSGGSGRVFFEKQSGGTWRFYAGNNLTTAENDTGDISLISGHLNGAGSTIRLNREQDGASSPGGNGMGGIRLGRDYNGSRPLTGMFCEMLVYSRLLDPSEIDDIEDYLHAKWFTDSPIDPPESTGIKVWMGSDYQIKPVKTWSGSEWQTKPLKRWSGTNWTETSY